VYTVRRTFSFRYQFTQQDTVVTIPATSINKLCTLPTHCTYVFRMILTANKHFAKHYWPAGRHNWVAMCFLWGKNSTVSNSRNSEEFHTSTVPWTRWSFAGISPRSPGFDPRPTAAHKLPLGQPFLRVLQRSVVGIIPSILHIHSHLNTLTAIIRGTNGWSLWTLCRYRGALDTEVLSHW